MKKISVVIPTIGEDVLIKTVKTLYLQDIIDEILIVFPPNYENLVDDSIFTNFDNVRLLFSDYAGQVNQRIFGFKHVQNNLILQIDSDIVINDVSSLVSTYENLYHKSALAPLIVDSFTKQPSQYYLNSKFLKNIYLKLLCNNNFVFGKFTIYGYNLPHKFYEQTTEVDWLPGGCVLHKKDFLIKDNFYNFNGKAYSEDLFHSYMLKRNNVKLFIDPSVIAETSLCNNFSFFDKFNDIKNSYLRTLDFQKFSIKKSYPFRTLIIFFIYYLSCKL